MVLTRSAKRRAASSSTEHPTKSPKTEAPKQDATKISEHIFRGVKVVLLDIEGTICPISFVKETLFPYALEALPAVLADKWDDEHFKTYRDAFPESATASPDAFEAHVKDLTQRDVKVAYLKNLQGFLWEEGYRSHAYATPVYPDVLTALKQWTSSSTHDPRGIAIYSSGSFFAQKLLFQHIKDPTKPDDVKAILDHRDMVSAWFDTTNAGLKQDHVSYTKIADELHKKPEEILFLSDNVKEVQAAIEAKMQAAIVDRPGNATLSTEDKKGYLVVDSFDQLVLDPEKDSSSN